ncbi:MAG: DUF6033 family protein [Lachnospiraceae bacterium]|nr:DUF6033 family protein [Lachnospiraceae bacterium]
MNKIGGYGMYQSHFYEKITQNKKAKTEKEEKTNKNNSVNLSKKAQNLLKELKKQYKNMDFIVADYATDEEAASYLSNGTKEYSVLIDPESLEEMASDTKTKEKYLSLIDEATENLSDVKDQLGKEGEEVTRLGVSIGKGGEVSYFAELEKSSAKQRERIEKAQEEKRAEKKSAAKEDRNLYGGVKRTRVTASSADELVEKIEQVDWSKIAYTDWSNTGKVNYRV